MIIVRDAEVGDTLICPACGVELYLDAMNGWRNDAAGYGCKPARSVHTDHIVTIPKKLINE